MSAAVRCQCYLTVGVIMLISIYGVELQTQPEHLSPAAELNFTKDVHYKEKQNETQFSIEMEVNTANWTFMDDIISSLKSVRLPLQLQNFIFVTTVDFTTVCSQYETRYYCRCVDQYVWLDKSCGRFKICDDVNNTCICIHQTTDYSPMCRISSSLALLVDNIMKYGHLKYPGSNLTITCNSSTTEGIKWEKNGAQIFNSDKYVISGLNLTVVNATPDENGNYSCYSTAMTSNNYVFLSDFNNSSVFLPVASIMVLPPPNIQVTNDKVIACSNSNPVYLRCCVQNGYTPKWNISLCTNLPPDSPDCIACVYYNNVTDCKEEDKVVTITCYITEVDVKKDITINITHAEFKCSDYKFGVGNPGDKHLADCDGDMVGSQTALCEAYGKWTIIEKNCRLRVIDDFNIWAKYLQVDDIPLFVYVLSSVTESRAQSIVHSPVDIQLIVRLLKTVTNLSQNITHSVNVMETFLQTVDVIGSKEAETTWNFLINNDTTQNLSSELLSSVEEMGQRLINDTVNIITPSIQLSKFSTSERFYKAFTKNSSTIIDIAGLKTNTSITIIVFSGLNKILPVRTSTCNNCSESGTVINGDVVVVQTVPKINNIFISNVPKNALLGNPKCVFWNFSILNNTGGWDTTGCKVKYQDGNVTCECDHTTSFSILMSPVTVKWVNLDYITYIGVGISMGSLVLCLIIEMIIWKSLTRNETSYLRHISIVNIAVSLLIADCCFIVGAAVVNKNQRLCISSTFFSHFFYLSLFFWMLMKALLLLNRSIMVSFEIPRRTMLTVAFSVGYGAPLLIAIITVASTVGGGGYIQNGYNCWLNWVHTKALLAFVIPVLIIVVINILVLVLCKMRMGNCSSSPSADQKHVLMVIAKCVGVLTPLFGLTWGFGIGTMVSDNFGVHVVFAFLNSLQGFLILVLGVVLDNEVRMVLKGCSGLRNSLNNKPGSSSSNVCDCIQMMQRGGSSVRQSMLSASSSSSLSSVNSDTNVNN